LFPSYEESNPVKCPTAGTSTLAITISYKPSATSTTFKTATARNSSTQTAPMADVTHDVSLKVISKKTVKGNEENAWSEMSVLQDLADHPNVVRLISLALLPTPPFSLPQAT
jgi:hypothetical protein